MPVFNITHGSTVEFTAGFFDGNGVPTMPSSATLTVAYSTGPGTTLVSSVIGMIPAGRYFMTQWATSQSYLGDVNYSVQAPGMLVPTTGLLRLIG